MGARAGVWFEQEGGVVSAWVDVGIAAGVLVGPVVLGAMLALMWRGARG